MHETSREGPHSEAKKEKHCTETFWKLRGKQWQLRHLKRTATCHFMKSGLSPMCVFRNTWNIIKYPNYEKYHISICIEFGIYNALLYLKNIKVGGFLKMYLLSDRKALP